MAMGKLEMTEVSYAAEEVKRANAVGAEVQMVAGVGDRQTENDGS